MKRALNFFYQQTGRKQPNIAELYDIERQRKNVFNRVTQFIDSLTPALKFVRHDECELRYKLFLIKRNEQTNDLCILILCPVCQKPIFFNRPSCLLGLDQQYVNNKKELSVTINQLLVKPGHLIVLFWNNEDKKPIDISISNFAIYTETG